jgi:hypothetical protein
MGGREEPVAQASEEHALEFANRIMELDRIVHKRIGVAETLNTLVHRYENELGPASKSYEWSSDLVYYRAGFLRAIHYAVDYLQEVNRIQSVKLHEFLTWEHDELWKSEKEPDILDEEE